MQLEIVSVERGQVLATCGPVFLRVIDRAPTDEAEIDRSMSMTVELSQRFDRAAGWVVIHHSAPLPTPAVLHYTLQRAQRLDPKISFEFTLLGLGFVARQSHAAVLSLLHWRGISAPVATRLGVSAGRLSRAVDELEPIDLLRAYDDASRRLLVGG